MSGGRRGIQALCDDNLADILARLPSKSLLRCLAACKTWRRIATDPCLLAAHAARRPIEMISRKLTTLQVNRTLLSVDDDDYNPADPPSQHLMSLMQMQLAGDGSCCPSTACDKFMLRYSVDGLLLLYQRTGLFIVCNPVTRQWTNLPPLSPHPCFTALTCGFYRYRRRRPSESTSTASCAIARSKARGATATTSSPPPPAPCLVSSSPPLRRLWRRVPVAHRGVLHWLEHPEATGTGKILAFDTVSETFRLMSGPPERAAGGGAAAARSLLELYGELAVADMLGVASLDIWALQRGEPEVCWTLRHRVEVPPPTRSRYYDTPLTPLPPVVGVVSLGAGGVILIGEPYGVKVARLYHLRDKKLIGEVRFGDMVPTFLTFQESCVSHAFFDAPRSPDAAYLNFEDVAYIFV